MFNRLTAIFALDASLTAMFSCTMLFSCGLVLSGCFIIDGKPLVDGYVVDIKNQEVLVTDHDPSAGTLACNNAVWFRNTPKEVQAGQKVRVWASEVAQSYPAQASADNLESVTPRRPKGAALTDAEAVRRALEDRRTRTIDGIPFVADIRYDTDEQAWRIVFAGGPGCELDVDPVLIRENVF